MLYPLSYGGAGGEDALSQVRSHPHASLAGTLRAPRMTPPSGEVNAIVQCIAFERARFRK